MLLLFLPSNRRSRGAAELRIAAVRVEHARPSGGGTQVSSPRSERALTVVVKTRRSLKPVEVRATGRCRAHAGPPGASHAVERSVGSRACVAHQSSTGAGASRLSSRDVLRGRERLVSSVSTDGSARLQIARCRTLPTVLGDGGFAAEFVEVLELTCPDLPAETEVLSETAAPLCEVAEVCARDVPTMRLPKTSEVRMIFIAIILRKGQGVHPGPNGRCATARSRLTRCLSCCAGYKCTADAKPLICRFLSGLTNETSPATLANRENTSAGRADKKSGY